MIRKLDDLELRGKVVFIRVDFNVPLNGTEISDDTRIRAALPTIQKVRADGGRVVLASHLGRPKGKRDPDFSLVPVGEHLAGLLDHPVVFAHDCVGDGVRKNIRDLREGDVLLLENTRFYAEETSNDEDFSRALAEGMEVYVNDAFGAAHRAHASTAGMARFVREKAAGYLMMKEIEALSGLLKEPERPFIALLGGAKVSDKLGVLDNLVRMTDAILVGGAMAYTFLAAKGKKTGTSRVERDRIAMTSQIIKAASARNVSLLLPEDFVVAKTFDENAETEIRTEIPDDAMGLDIGPKTVDRYTKAIREAKTIFWNGPMGVFEWAQFANGTESVAKAVAESRAVSVVGGGDSVYAIQKLNLANKVTHVSTGGGASLEFMEGKTLPGVKALEE